MAKNRDKLLEMLNGGSLDAERLAKDLLGWLSDDDCVQFAHANDIQLEDEDDEEFTYTDEDEVNEAFAEEWGDDDSDMPAKRQAFVEFVDRLQKDGEISEELAYSVTLNGDD